VLTVMATLAIMIASLGLLGMIIYALERRTKEIGIRKVNGATLADILLLISRSYVKLIVLAFVIGAPIAYWMMDRWLQDFAYRITPPLWIFASYGLWNHAHRDAHYQLPLAQSIVDESRKRVERRIKKVYKSRPMIHVICDPKPAVKKTNLHSDS